MAAVIKLRAEGRAGSSASLMSVRSVCVSSVALPRGPLVKRGPAMDGACPLCAFVLCGGGESQGPSTAKDRRQTPPLNALSVTA